jgi:hypothetical protein
MLGKIISNRMQRLNHFYIYYIKKRFEKQFKNKKVQSSRPVKPNVRVPDL